MLKATSPAVEPTVEHKVREEPCMDSESVTHLMKRTVRVPGRAVTFAALLAFCF